MKERLIGLVRTYVLFVVLFVVQKPLFMAVYARLYADVAWTDWLRVMWHGLPLDLSLAGYLSALPGLLFIASVWTLGRGVAPRVVRLLRLRVRADVCHRGDRCRTL